MNDVVADNRGSLLHRVMQTPLRRLVRGKIGPGRTVEDVVASLPGEAAAVVREVARLTRLWRTEKLSLAEELAAHFHDGLDAGATAVDLVRDFGDPRTAAKLIRRAKIRNRPIAWHISRWTLRTIAVLILLYIAAGLYYLSGEATPTVDYVAQLQAPIKSVPEEERAWPLYREALLRMEELPEVFGRARLGGEALAELYPGHERWPAIAEYLDKHQEAISLIRRGADKPALGYVMGVWDEADAPLWPDQRPPIPSGDLWDSPMFSILLPHLAKMREMSVVLWMDLHRAAAEGDADAAVADLRALLGIAQHAADATILINQLVGLAILRTTLSEIQQVLARYPALFRDEGLTVLAHALVSADQVLRIDISGERQMFHDVIQRTFTQGEDGYLTFEGLDAFRQLHDGPKELEELLATTAGYPAMVMAVASRKEILEEYDRRMMRTYEQRADQPMWKWTAAGAVDASGWNEMSSIERLHVFPVRLLLPSISRMGLTVEWGRAERDVTQVALALELYRRQHGGYPAALEQMMPRLLPRVPPDPFTGDPVRYRIVDGSPLVYSMGVDRDDDGGRAIAHGSSQPDPAREWMPVEQLPGASDVQGAARIDGDWILYDPTGVSDPDADGS